MHPVLIASLKRIERHYAGDTRCAGMYLWGSISNDTADAWSDVDVAGVFADADFPAIKQEFRATCEALCGPILVVLPEGEQAEFVNYAFLFEAEERLHLYDFTLLTEGFLRKAAWLRPQKILFDKTGLLAEAARREPPAATTFGSQHLLHEIDNYWVYAYLNGKYFQRQDVYKMLYVQHVLMQTHLRALRSFHPGEEWNWWARDIHKLSEDHQAEFMVYFGATTPQHIAQALWREFDLFSRDARAACATLGAPYPAALEQGVRQHLQIMGLAGI